jgi:dTMP kinase
MRGKLVVFEGLDKAGKSTQCSRLVENLRYNGYEVQHVRFPGRFECHIQSLAYSYLLDRTTAIGKMIDAYLKGEASQEDHVIHLLFSANRWELA